MEEMYIANYHHDTLNDSERFPECDNADSIVSEVYSLRISASVGDSRRN